MDKKENLLGQKIGVSLFVVVVIATVAYVKQLALGQIILLIPFIAIITRVTIWPKQKTYDVFLHEQETKDEKELLSTHPILRHSAVIQLSILALGLALLFQTRWPSIKQFAFIIMTGGLMTVMFFIDQAKKKKVKEEQIAVASEIGFTFSDTGDPSTLPELLRNFGRRQRVTDVFSGTMNNFLVRIFDYSYTYMKNATYRATILEITTARIFPTMMILSTSDNLHATIAPKQLLDGVPVHLEGNFSRYFTVYVAHGAEDDVRQFLTPDIMATLIDDMAHMSVIFAKNKVYVAIADSSEIHFMKDVFMEQIAKVRFMLTKWSPILSRGA